MSLLCVLAKHGKLPAEASGWKTYVALRLDDKSVCTKSMKGQTPQWDGELELEVDRLDQTASIELWHRKLFSQHLLGRMLVPLDGIPHKPHFGGGEWYTLWMQSPDGSRYSTAHSLFVDIRYELPNDLSAEESEALAEKLRVLDGVFLEEMQYLREQSGRLQTGASPPPSVVPSIDEDVLDGMPEKPKKRSVGFVTYPSDHDMNGGDLNLTDDYRSATGSLNNSRAGSVDYLESSRDGSPVTETKTISLWKKAKAKALEATQSDKLEHLLERLPHLTIFLDTPSSQTKKQRAKSVTGMAEVVMRAANISQNFLDNSPQIRQRAKNLTHRRAKSFRNLMKRRKDKGPTPLRTSRVGPQLLRDEELRLHVYTKTLQALIYPISKAQPHNFETFSAHYPVFCYECGGLLWGLARQGLKCKECGVRSHKKCKDLMNADCLLRQAERGIKHKDHTAMASAKHAMDDIMKKQMCNEHKLFDHIRDVFQLPDKRHRLAMEEARSTVLEGTSKWSANVRVKVIEAQSLAAKDKDTGTSDPYVTVKVGSQKKRTKTIQQNLNPHWGQEFRFECHDSADRIKVRVWDEDNDLRSKIKHKFISEADDFLGQTIIEVRTLCGEMDVWYNLEQRTGKSEVSGAIHLHLSVHIEGEESQAPYHLQYTSLHDTMFHFEYIRNLDALNLPSEPGKNGWKVFFNEPAQSIVTEFATRFGIEDIYRAMTHFACLTTIYNESGVPAVMCELLTHINDYFLSLEIPVVASQDVTAAASANQLEFLNFPKRKFVGLLDSLMDKLKIDLCGYRDLFPSSEPDRLEDMKASINLLTNILYFHLVVLKKKSTPKCEFVIEGCIKECVRRTYTFIKGEIVSILGHRDSEGGGDEIGVDEAGEFFHRSASSYDPFEKTPARALGKLLELVMAIIEEDIGNYNPIVPKLGTFNFGSTCAHELWNLYESDMRDVVVKALAERRKAKSVSPETQTSSGSEVPSTSEGIFTTTDAMKLLLNVNEVYHQFVCLSSDGDEIPDYQMTFAPCVLRWLQESEAKQSTYLVSNAFSADRDCKFKVLSENGKYSASVVDIFCSITEISRVLQTLACPEPEISDRFMALFARMVATALQLYAEKLLMELKLQSWDSLTECVFLNNFVEMRSLLSKLYKSINGDQIGERASAILNYVQNDFLGAKMNEMALVYAQTMEGKIIESVQTMRTRLISLRSSDRDLGLAVVTSVMKLLSEWKNEVINICEHVAVKKILKILWQMIISHIQKIIVLPPLPDIRELAKAVALDLNDDQCECVRICTEELKDFFSAWGLKRATLDKSKEFLQLKQALNLYGQGTDELIGLFVEKEKAQGACGQECVGELQMQVSLFESEGDEYRLSAKVVHATDLKWPASFGMFRPYVELTLVGPKLSGKKRRQATHSKSGTLSPTYNETFHFNWHSIAVSDGNPLSYYELHVCVKDYCFARTDRVVGVTVLGLQDIAEAGSRWLHLALSPAINVSETGRAILGILVGRIQDEVVREFVHLKVTARDRELDA